MRSKHIALIVLGILISLDVLAGPMIQYQFLYFTREDDVDQFTYNRMNNAIFVGASTDKKERLYIGPSYHIWNKSNGTGGGTEDELSLTEFGATVIFFLDKEGVWKTSATYNLLVSGERTTSGTTEDIDGSSYLLSFGYQVRISKQLYIGLSMNYHSITISESVTGTTSSEVSESYTTIYPMADFSFRF